MAQPRTFLVTAAVVSGMVIILTIQCVAQVSGCGLSGQPTLTGTALQAVHPFVLGSYVTWLCLVGPHWVVCIPFGLLEGALPCPAVLVAFSLG